MSYFVQPVSADDLYNYQLSKTFSMIDNYVYLYHTDTLIAIPTYPESIADSMGVSFNPTSPLARSAPIYTYQNSGPRSFQVQLDLHRDMMTQINTSSSRLNISNLDDPDYTDILVNQLQAAAVPSYAAAEKMVNPPIVAVRFGSSIFCKGVVTGNVSVVHSGPILRTDKYAMLQVSFTINEVDPYDAESIMLQGGFRGLSTSLERRVWKK